MKSLEHSFSQTQVVELCGPVQWCVAIGLGSIVQRSSEIEQNSNHLNIT